MIFIKITIFCNTVTHLFYSDPILKVHFHSYLDYQSFLSNFNSHQTLASLIKITISYEKILNFF